MVDLTAPRKRLLLRSSTSPFDAINAERAIKRNAIASNSGNLLFLHAAYRLLAVPGVTIDIDRMRTRPDEADRISASYDAYVVPFANAFRPAYAPMLERWADLAERLRIPVTILGVGAQSTLDPSVRSMASIDGIVRRLVAAVLERAPSVGVRGEFTAEYLAHLGFRGDLVEVIGCPSVFINGPQLSVRKRVPDLTAASPIAVNGAPYQAAMGPIIRRHFERYPDMVYVAQDPAMLETLTYGAATTAVPHPDGFPNSIDDPMIQENKVRIFLAAYPWLDLMRTRDFAFGARLHGNLAALMAGTPAFILTHDSRTLELARYLEIPNRPLSSVGPDIDAAELYATADYRRTVGGHPERWERFARFLRDHGIGNVFDDGGAAGFDERVSRIAFATPGDPSSWSPPDGGRPAARLSALARVRAALTRHGVVGKERPPR